MQKNRKELNIKKDKKNGKMGNKSLILYFKLVFKDAIFDLFKDHIKTIIDFIIFNGITLLWHFLFGSN